MLFEMSLNPTLETKLSSNPPQSEYHCENMKGVCFISPSRISAGASPVSLNTLVLDPRVPDASKDGFRIQFLISSPKSS